MEEIQKKNIIETFELSDAYQLLINPITDEINGMERAYEVSGDKAAYLKGKYEGLKFVQDLIDMYKRGGVELNKRIIEDNPEEPKEI